MTRPLIFAIFVCALLSCTTTAWQYAGNQKMSADSEKMQFEKDHHYCKMKEEIAEGSVVEYGLSSDPGGAYDHCMQTKGWELIKLD